MELIRDTAYEVSVELAREKGAFPFIDNAKYLQAPFIRRLPRKLQDRIAKHGIRNSHLLAIAPAGTISLLADNVSSGIEPIYSLQATREVRDHDLKIQTLILRDHAFSRWLDTTNETRQIACSLCDSRRAVSQSSSRYAGEPAAPC